MFRRFRHRWEDNVKMNLAEMKFEGVDWIYHSWVGTGGRLL
jgi:hypothetical protein